MLASATKESEENKMSKSVKKIVAIVAGAIVALVIVIIAAILLLRIDAAEAEQIALEYTGGGEIVEREISSEGLWKEYDYIIQNGDQWYNIEISGFGNIEDIESGTGTSWRY